MSSGISSIFSLKRSYAIKRKHINDKSGHSDKSILPEIIRDYTEKDVFGMTVNSLRSDWLEMMERREFYIDKTLLIKYEDLSEESLPMVFSHPAGFGKSLYLSMLYNFYDCMADSETRNARYTQFMKCKIFRTSRRFFENNFASTPCIYLSFKNVVGETEKELNWSFRNTILKTIVPIFNQIILPSVCPPKKLFRVRSWERYDDLIMLKRSIENPFSCEEDEHYISGIVILETVIDLLEYIYEKKCLIFVDDFDSACGFDKNGGTSTIKRFGEKEKFAQRFFYIQKLNGIKPGQRVLSGITCKTDIKQTPAECDHNKSKRIALYRFKYVCIESRFGFSEDQVRKLIKRALYANQNIHIADEISVLKIAKEMYSGYLSNTGIVFNPKNTIRFANRLATIKSLDDQHLMSTIRPNILYSPELELPPIIDKVLSNKDDLAVEFLKSLLAAFWQNNNPKLDHSSSTSEYSKFFKACDFNIKTFIPKNAHSTFFEDFSIFSRTLLHLGIVTEDCIGYYIPNFDAEQNVRCLLAKLKPRLHPYLAQFYGTNKLGLFNMLNNSHII